MIVVFEYGGLGAEPPTGMLNLNKLSPSKLKTKIASMNIRLQYYTR